MESAKKNIKLRMSKYMKPSSNKGINLVSLSVSIIVILTLTAIILNIVADNLQVETLRNLQADIQNLRDKISVYYAQTGSIPANKEWEYTDIENLRNAGIISEAVDTGKFYVIDLSAIENLTLIYGKDYEKLKSDGATNKINDYKDIYIINETSLNIFYVAGVEIDGEYFYTDYTKKDVDKQAPVLRYVDGVEIPANFYYVGGSKQEGLVISDVKEDDLENSKHGNQFVWIPVDQETFDTKFKRTEGYENGELQSMLSDCSEPADENYEEAMAMYESVKENGGFYIARYEAGEEIVNGEQTIVSKKGATVYSTPWYSAVREAQDFASKKGYKGLTSTLCYGVQWDAVMNFMDPNYITNEVDGKPTCDADSYVRNSRGRGWELKSSDDYQEYKPAGEEIKDSQGNILNEVKNIYDMAGNIPEWTMENQNYSYTFRIFRGGGGLAYYEENVNFSSASARAYMPTYDYCSNGVRLTLFLNKKEKWSQKYDVTGNYKDKNGDVAKIPAGFQVSEKYGENNIEDGLVVKGPDGSEFVWVPVPDYSKFKRTEGYEKGELQEILADCAEPDATSDNEEAIEMYESVKENGGFYIARYEAGDGTVNGNQTMISQKGTTVCFKSWEDALQGSRNFANINGYTGVQSTLCYGVQWDAALNFIDPNYITNETTEGKPNCKETSYVRNSVGRGWYMATEEDYQEYKLAGEEIKDAHGNILNKVKNIYDMAGNILEFTMEDYTKMGSMTICRGGSINNYEEKPSASTRGYVYIRPGYGSYGVRITLYIQ